MMKREMSGTAFANDMAATAFRHVETVVYAGLGGLLSVSALLALGSAGMHVWSALGDWSTTTAIFSVWGVHLTGVLVLPSKGG